MTANNGNFLETVNEIWIILTYNHSSKHLNRDKQICEVSGFIYQIWFTYTDCIAIQYFTTRLNWRNIELYIQRHANAANECNHNRNLFFGNLFLLEQHVTCTKFTMEFHRLKLKYDNSEASQSKIFQRKSLMLHFAPAVNIYYKKLAVSRMIVVH